MTLHIEDFAKISYSTENTGFPFGLEHERTVAALRKLAQLVEDGIFCIQKIDMNQSAKTDDWATTTLVLTYVEKVKP